MRAEAGATDFWFKYVGLDGRVIGLDSFGESAPAEEVLRHFGFNVEHVIEEVKRAARLTRGLGLINWRDRWQ